MPPMLAAAKSLTLYKDFNKDVKDMLTKSYSDAQKWKLESKFKGPEDKLFVNPMATSDGKFSVDVEYAPRCGAALKATLEPSTCNVNLTASYLCQGHKVEAVGKKNGEYELSHEFVMPSRMSSHAKLVNKTVEVGVATAVAPHCQVGCGALCTLDGKKDYDLTLGCRYAYAGYALAIRTNKLRSYTTSFVTPIPKCPHHVLVGAEVVCGRGQGWTGTLGFETACVLFKGNTLKARVNKNKEWAVVYIAKLVDNWTAAVTLDKNLKPGVLLTHS
ncbi:voltage-dependent anion-selective channel, putative [Trypanosoma cruzi]|uniref:Putative Mitochondrial outer membrane protein porin n=1 Tax=Trypanosoma cruzi TaxID=5693 RepID=A0A2V2VBP0_TRYCR|nr:voltage-dependent anion-selective channel, putative [Trypanosoma cruzi]PBJ71640.1 voltage-dependent anion-selective channel (VDAC) [Trypanosoma cruzi cruzi]KAF8290891.1 putative Mitochondrial outer membrane protein porin [Trypanosoma cruzi]PBJ71641.1 voltage-dependent anion-selective channel (VDAC) [Trypanosoma cruzi cruzi]PBJ71642.1 voltage-dependent anion-selective channel (VDAC) [Trypanosoma cruzi cruzi]